MKVYYFLSFVHLYYFLCFFFFKQKTAYEMRISDWSSDVCSSDLRAVHRHRVAAGLHTAQPLSGAFSLCRKMERPMTITRHYVLAAGGTGGHMIPAHAVAVELMERGHHVALVTDDRGAKIPGLFDKAQVHILPAGRMAGGPVEIGRAKV